WQWNWDDDTQLVWGSGALVVNLLAVLQRRQIEEGSDTASAPWASVDADATLRPTPLEDVARFIDADVDEERLEDLIVGLACCRATRTGTAVSSGHAIRPPAVYALLKVVTD